MSDQEVTNECMALLHEVTAVDETSGIDAVVSASLGATDRVVAHQMLDR